MICNIELQDNNKVRSRQVVHRGYCVSNKCCVVKRPFSRDPDYLRHDYLSKVLKVTLDKQDHSLRCPECKSELFWKIVRFSKDSQRPNQGSRGAKKASKD